MSKAIMNEYEPKGVHVNFVIPNDEFTSKEEPKIKVYRYINKQDELIGEYFGINIHWVAKKILTKIFHKTGIRCPIYEVYDEEADMIYKYAGEVTKIKKPLVKYLENDDNNIKKIIQRNKYVVRQISKQKRKILEGESEEAFQ